MTDLSNLHQNMMDKLNELMNNLENVFADKDQTRKKLAALEKEEEEILKMEAEENELMGDDDSDNSDGITMKDLNKSIK